MSDLTAYPTDPTWFQNEMKDYVYVESGLAQAIAQFRWTLYVAQDEVDNNGDLVNASQLIQDVSANLKDLLDTLEDEAKYRTTGRIVDI